MGKKFELKFCESCFQMTNHIDGVCQKCLPNKKEDSLAGLWRIIEEPKLHAERNYWFGEFKGIFKACFEAGRRNAMKPYTTDLAEEDCPDFETWYKNFKNNKK